MDCRKRWLKTKKIYSFFITGSSKNICNPPWQSLQATPDSLFMPSTYALLWSSSPQADLRCGRNNNAVPSAICSSGIVGIRWKQKRGRLQVVNNRLIDQQNLAGDWPKIKQLCHIANTCLSMAVLGRPGHVLHKLPLPSKRQQFTAYVPDATIRYSQKQTTKWGNHLKFKCCLHIKLIL